MKQPASITVSIPHPCTQNWDEMTPNDKGRHCMHCRETVIDFTTWSDTALYNFFQGNQGSVCGRFLPTQLDHAISIPYQPHSRLYRLTIALGLTLLFTQTHELLAQNRPPKTEQSSFTKNADTTANGRGSISGIVLDEKKEPMIYAAIQVFQDGVLKGGNVTDYDGRYVIKNLDAGTYNMLVLYTGYDSLKADIKVDMNKTTVLNFTFKQQSKHQSKTITIFTGKPLINSDMDKPGTRTFRREEIDNTPMR